ncbi:MAG: hypothetical protein AAF639_05780 [Chloroflexota bacterium]
MTTETSTMESKNQSSQQGQSWRPSKGNILFSLCVMLVTIGLTLGTVTYALSTGIINVGAASLNQPAANAPSNSIIPYQGRLADADGNPLSATVDMHFRLYDTAEGGIPLWAEAWTEANGVQVNDGLFNVMLGSMTPISATVMSENNSLFLGLAAGDDDEMVPRVQLGSVPFAMQGWRVPDGSITSEKLASNLIDSYVVTMAESHWDVPNCSGLSDDIDASWAAISNFSIDFSLSQQKTVWIDFSGLGRNDGAGRYIYSNVFIDGTRTLLASGEPDLSGCSSSYPDSSRKSYCPLSNIVGTTLQSGDHTIDVRIMCNGGVNAGEVYGGTLRALVLP